MRIGLFGALVLIIMTAGAPLILAFDCNAISPANYNTCIEIKNSNLTDAEKDLIISNLDYTKKFFPYHNFVFNKNTNLVINSAPVGIQNYNGIFVKNAWMSIFAVMPSILYNNTLYVPNKTQVLTGFNYQIQTPTNYYSSGYPNTNNGDCQREYSLTQNTSENRVYVNNQYQGSGRLVELNISSDSQIKAVYSVNVAYSVTHYYWQRYCSRYRRGICIQYSYRCAYNYNEVKSDSIPITDYLNVKLFNNSLVGDVKTIYSYAENTKLEPNYTNSIELTFQDSYFKSYEFTYDINYSKAPYYVYTLKAENYKQEKINNIYKDGSSLILKNTNNCTIKAWDFFSSIQNFCFLEPKPINFSIKTDKLTYKANETIKISIFPKNISVNLTYANQTKQVMGNSSFIAEPLSNKITATYYIYQAEKVIFVQDREKFLVIWNFSIFGFLNYALYCVLRKCFGGFI